MKTLILLSVLLSACSAPPDGVEPSPIQTAEAGPACAPDDTQCAGPSIRVCGQDGQWRAWGACPYACIAERGVGCVGECVPQSTAVDECGEVHDCDAVGSWVPPLYADVCPDAGPDQ